MTRLLERQSAYVAAHGTPTFFLHHLHRGVLPAQPLLRRPNARGAGLPGGGHRAMARVRGVDIIVAVLAGYFGMCWTARNLGLSRELAVLPAATLRRRHTSHARLGPGAWPS